VYAADLAYVHDAGFGDLARSAAPEIVRMLRDCGIRRGRIVEVGCGSGIAAEYFLAHGYDVTGFDTSAAMIRLARAKAPAARFQAASLERAKLPACDAVVAIGEVVSYVGGLPALEKFFRRVHAALQPRGVLLFDFVHSVARRTFTARSFGGPGWALASSAAFETSRRILTRRIVIVRLMGRRVRRASEVHRVRVYTRLEIRGALERAGFAVRMSRCYGSYRLMQGDIAVIATRRASM
jgi:SAM-dependent methyltransferase